MSRRDSNSATTILLRTLAGSLMLGCVPFPALSQGTPPQAPPQFIQTCALCHGSDAAGTDRAPALAGVVALRDMPDDMPVEISASGSQSDVGDGTSVNSFTVTVTPKWGFLSK